MNQNDPMTPTSLSPAAQAVLDATGTTGTPLELAARGIAAAALRAAANNWRVDVEVIDGVEYIRTSTLERIAAELEGRGG
jgi:hypothetical protein